MPDSTTTESPNQHPANRPAKGWLEYLARATRFRGLVPAPLKRLGRRLIDRDAYYSRLWELQDQCADAEEVSTYSSKLNVRLGIVKEFFHMHRQYIAACRDIGVPYRLVDISGPNWIDVVTNSGCDAFLVRPSALLTPWKQMFDERLRVMVHQLGKIIYPSLEEIWIYESKRRMHYWLKANGVPHPQTWVFYSRDDALDFASSVELPIVYKSDLGSGSSGVRIFRQRRALIRCVTRCFKKGIVRQNSDPRDRQWGCVVLQEFLPEVAEWRISRVGDSYGGYPKARKGDFHSGSNVRVTFEDPPKELLDLARETTEKGGFTSMGVDIFKTADGRHLVNELQTVFSATWDSQMFVKGKPGRYLYDEATETWRFEEGFFSQNGCCNLRVEVVLKMLGHDLPVPPSQWGRTEHIWRRIPRNEISMPGQVQHR